MFKIVVAVDTEPVSLAEARLHIKADSDTSEDTLITTWITAAREIAEHYTGRGLAPQTLEMAFDAFPSYEFDLDRSPVASITSIKYTDADGVEQTIGSSNYALSLYGLCNIVTPAYSYTWPTARGERDAVRVRYVAGYTAVPKAVKAAILLMVAWMNEHRGDEMDPADIQPPAAKALLGTERIWSVR